MQGKRLERKRLNIELYRILEERILTGALFPGTKLSEEGVAGEFGVSRSPAREAIMELQRRGLAERSGARDRMVALPTETLVAEAFEMWWVLDSIRLYLSSKAATPEEHARLQELLAAMEAMTGEEPGAEHRRLSEEFHALLTRHAGNSQLDRMMDDNGRYIRWFKALYFEKLDTSPSSHEEHRTIVECYIRSDLPGLMEVIQRHILRQRDAILQRFAAIDAAAND